MDVYEDFQQIADEISSAEERNVDDKDRAINIAFEAKSANEPSSSINFN